MIKYQIINEDNIGKNMSLDEKKLLFNKKLLQVILKLEKIDVLVNNEI